MVRSANTNGETRLEPRASNHLSPVARLVIEITGFVARRLPTTRWRPPRFAPVIPMPSSSSVRQIDRLSRIASAELLELDRPNSASTQSRLCQQGITLTPALLPAFKKMTAGIVCPFAKA